MSVRAKAVVGTGEQAIRKCRNALFLTDPEIDRETLISAKGERVAGTCEWIREDNTFRQWLEGHSSLLWITGGPGKGKTMLSIFITQYLERTFKENTQVVFYFCRHDDDKRNSAVAILRGLLWQILGRQPDLANGLMQYFESPERTQSSLSSREALWAMFSKTLQAPSLHATRCVLDALDECDEASRTWLIKKLRGLMLPNESASRGPSFNFTVVSRHMPGLEGVQRVKLDPDHDDEVKSDIAIFVSDRVGDLSLRVTLDDGFRQYVGDKLLKGANGTFLWVGFAMMELFEKQTCLEIEETLCSLPKGLPAIYGRILLQIEPQRRNACADILTWVTLAIRPLSAQELAAALPAPATSKLTRVQVIRDWIALCGPIIAIEDGRVSLVHQSARDYLLRSDEDSDPILEGFRILPEKAHLQLAWTCLSYMQQSSVLKGESEDALTSVMVDPDYPLMHYAANHWSKHAISSKTLGMKLLDHPSGFFEDDSNLHWRWSKASTMEYFWLFYGSSSTSLHRACYLGFIPWVKHCLEKTGRETERRSRINDVDNHGKSPLIYAARQGHEELVRFLLYSKADVNATDVGGFTALHSAAQEGQKSVVRLLMDHGADANAKEKHGWTVLHFAVAANSETVTQTLLASGVDANVKDSSGQTALHMACEQGSGAIVRLLLDYGANADAKDSDGDTALNAAASSGITRAIEMLLTHGADVDTPGIRGQTGLFHAAREGHGEVMRLLLDHGADCNTKDIDGQPVLIAAATEGYNVTMQLLLKAGANTNATDRGGNTALHIAAEEGEEALVQLLLDYGANVDAKNNDGETAFHLAVHRQHKTVVQLLRSMCSDDYDVEDASMC